MNKKYESCIQPFVPQDLCKILFHTDRSGIERFVAKDFPLHMAVHHVDCNNTQPEECVSMHFHEQPEINIILPDEKELIYEIKIDDEVYIVNGYSAVWIPARIKHAANLIRGKGYFICVILSDFYEAFM